ncbi:MAG: cell wall-active antibiotics response protein [Tissierellia bacterium]|nr:cell wall-active antibiotics response protein [Tissierellia bacterium]
MRNKSVFTGILFILAGLALLINKLGYFQEISLFNAFLSIILLYHAIKNLRRRNFGGVLFPLAFIGILFSKELGIESLSPWTLLAVATLGSIGLSLIFKPKFYKISSIEFDDEVLNRMEINDDGAAFMSVKFSSGVRYLNIKDFKKAAARSKFGDLKVYFDGSYIEDEAVMDVDVIFGNLTLFVPKEWVIINHVDVIFGDFKYIGSPYESSSKKLIVDGDVKFGDIKIIYV